ncbi:lantibiotic dehydratase [Streptomyces griseorubiginosus]|uniref:lantibiotic dehydratase n=1 Tax=Streptomyces griseorubiginosus TaxID=67304 RepID=UPI0036E7FDE7
MLVPLRRDVYNRRSPRQVLRSALGDLDYKSPLLDAWLSARDEIDRLGDRLDAIAEAALRADRAGLAGLCRSEDLQRAVALISENLLRAVQRAAAGNDEPDKQARKSEATVLRYAMRAVTKTNPLSWFSHVSWGHWREAPRGLDQRSAGPLAVVRVQRYWLENLVQAVLEHRQTRTAVDYQLAQGMRSDGPWLYYRRPSPADKAPPGLAREEQVALPLTAPLRHVLARVGVGKTVRQHDLVADITSRLPHSPGQAEHAAAYVAVLVDQGVLQPAFPFDPQAEDVVREASRWLVSIGFAELAEVLGDIAADTETYARLPARSRPERLAQIRSHWSAAFSLVGEALPKGSRAPLTEDVVTAGVTTLGASHGSRALPDVASLGPLFELFDGHTVVRRMIRDRFVARFGVGGICDSLVEFADEMVEVWQVSASLNRDGMLGDADNRRALSPQVRDLLRIRADLAAAVPGAGLDGVVVLPEKLVDDAECGRPFWLCQRPVSFSVFAQPVPDGAVTRLCVNHVYGGWGRFTSRFLDHLDPRAKQQVSAQIAGALDGRERAAQVRPVGGFNANLHPRLVADEVSESAAWATLQPENLQLVHDTAGDQLRLRVAATGELISVLYLGFLMPLVLPGRSLPLVTDLESGMVDFGQLVPGEDRETAMGRIGYQPRLRYRDVILSRARWRLPQEMVQAWRAELDKGAPVHAASRWRALLGVPEHIFVSAAAPEDSAGLNAVMSYTALPRSQYVDLGSALHLRCLSRTLARYPGSLIIEEALPVPKAGVRTIEIVAETYRSHP